MIEFNDFDLEGVGRVKAEESRYYWRRNAMYLKVDELLSVELTLPDVDDPEPVSIEINETLDAEHTHKLARFLAFIADFADQINAGAAERIAEAERKRAEEAAEQERQRAARVALLQERQERLLIEFLGDEVKVRERGYKTMRRAYVSARQDRRYNDDTGQYEETGEYKLRLDYVNDERTQSIGAIQRLDVRVGSRWMTVWDDGVDDVYGGLASSAAPAEQYDGRLAGG